MLEDRPALPGAALRRHLAGLLPLCLVAFFAACVAGGAARGPYPGLAQYAGREVRRVDFAGGLVVPEDSLRAVIMTHPTRCTLPLLPYALCPGFARARYRLDLSELARDALRIQLYYRDHGYYGTRVDPGVESLGGDRIAVRFAIVPGDEVTLRSLEVEGADSILPVEALTRKLPLQVGRPFGRAAFLASADTIREALLQRGYAYAEVLRNYDIDTIADFAQAQYIAVPGPVVHVDTVLFRGTDRLRGRTARRQLTFHEGDVLRATELNRSQRNLYGLDLVNFASVEVAPDSLQRTPADSTSATVLVRVVEAPRYLVDANVGFGTIDCLRTGAQCTDRDFLGGARRLEISGSLSKIGVGEPADFGLQSSLCRALVDDPFSDRLNYRVAADFQQPELFGARNRLGARVHADRFSEFQVYLRESVGGQLALSRQASAHSLYSTTLDVERGATRASPVIFCIIADVCSPGDVARLQRRRWSNSLALTGLWDHTAGTAFTVRGYQLRSGVAWASQALGSDDEYLRGTIDGAAYHQLRPGWVLAGRLQLGTFARGALNPSGPYIPPERRFYAGGPNSVRGFPRNGLGPRAYLLDTAVVNPAGDTTKIDAKGSATGGTRLAVASAELRVPSPVLSEYLRFAAFVDAGQVWAPGTRATAEALRFTPGIGLRFTTPVGPIRVDAAYNPYGQVAGPLYEETPDGSLRLVRPSFTPPSGGFWSRMQLHFAVGQAF
jgi:outer membrane protein assembly complex protein YaeT